jgi:hypothetical protein
MMQVSWNAALCHWMSSTRHIQGQAGQEKLSLLCLTVKMNHNPLTLWELITWWHSVTSPKNPHLQNDRHMAKNRNAHLTMKSCTHIEETDNIHVQRVNKFTEDKEINVSRIWKCFKQKIHLIITKTEDSHSSSMCESLLQRLIIQCCHIVILYFPDMSIQTIKTYRKSFIFTLRNYKNLTHWYTNFITANMKVVLKG